MFAARQLSLARPIAGRRLFHATAPTLVKVGDKLPNVELMENSPGNKVNIAEELKSGKGLIIGKPPVDADHIQDCSFIDQLVLIRYRIQVCRLRTLPPALRTISLDTSTHPSSRMLARSSLSLSTTALCKCACPVAQFVQLVSSLPRLLRLSRVEVPPVVLRLMQT
jgi:hypothetical protein